LAIAELAPFPNIISDLQSYIANAVCFTLLSIILRVSPNNTGNILSRFFISALFRLYLLFLSLRCEMKIAIIINATTYEVKLLEAGTATSLPQLTYTPQLTLFAINDPTTFITPILNIPLFLQYYKHLYISAVSPDYDINILPAYYFGKS